MARVGIFGGTFDPPHLGHLILAAESADQLGLNRVLWMVAPIPPHKRGRSITSYADRVEMVRRCIGDDKRFRVSTLENERPGPHYTADTLAILRERQPDDSFVLLIGQDSLNDLFEWHEPDRIIAQIDGLGVMARPGELFETERLLTRFPELAIKLSWADAPLLEISSTEIRARVKAGRHFRYYLRPEVADYIVGRGFYQDAVPIDKDSC